MPDIELFDETLDINTTENYEISIQVGLDGFSFALLDTIRNKFVLLRGYEPDDTKGFNNKQLKEIIAGDDFLQQKYRRSLIIHPARKSTIVPSALFDPAKKESFFYFNHLRDDDEEILINRLKYPESFLLYSVPGSMSELLSDLFPQGERISHLKSLLHYSTVTGRKVADNHINLHIERGFFNIIASAGSKVTFCNTYSFRNVSDIMYYLFYIYELMGIDQATPLIISGRTDIYGDLYDNIKEYSTGVRYAHAPAGSFFSYAIEEIPVHRYLNLFNSLLCV